MGHIRVLKKSFIASLLLFALLAQPTPAISFSAKYKNCAQLKAKYRFGVALSLKAAGDYPATISKRIYLQNGYLDFDSDGIVCENERLQINLNPNTKPSVATTTTTTVVPLPTSPVRLPFKTEGTTYLRKGVTYQFVYCSERAETVKYMDILSISTGWTQKAIGIQEGMKCSVFPYTVTYSWIVTESPGEVSKIRLRGYNNQPEMNIVITN
jgi:hypothetical protein